MVCWAMLDWSPLPLGKHNFYSKTIRGVFEEKMNEQAGTEICIKNLDKSFV
jgi:hypothetical protein